MPIIDKRPQLVLLPITQERKQIYTSTYYLQKLSRLIGGRDPKVRFIILCTKIPGLFCGCSEETLVRCQLLQRLTLQVLVLHKFHLCLFLLRHLWHTLFSSIQFNLMILKHKSETGTSNNNNN